MSEAAVADALPVEPTADQLLGSPAYRLAVMDPDFMLRDEMRAFRFAQEHAKAALVFKDWRIESTVGIFGSARIRPREAAERLLRDAEQSRDEGRIASARRCVELSRWYETAREFARIVATRGGSMKIPTDRAGTSF